MIVISVFMLVIKDELSPASRELRVAGESELIEGKSRQQEEETEVWISEEEH